MVWAESVLHFGWMADARQMKDRIAEALKAGRRAKKLTQEDLAAAVECSVETLSNAERGVSLPSLELFLDLVRVLDIDVTGLVGAPEPKRPLSKDRIRLETGVGLVARNLKDEHLRYWLEMGRVFEKG
jgi:transcriptional regulator with XRE-family HTH domain